MTNVAKHARASNVDVILERRGDHVLLIVEDDGVGIRPSGRRDGAAMASDCSACRNAPPGRRHARDRIVAWQRARPSWCA